MRYILLSYFITISPIIIIIIFILFIIELIIFGFFTNFFYQKRNRKERTMYYRYLNKKNYVLNCVQNILHR